MLQATFMFTNIINCIEISETFYKINVFFFFLSAKMMILAKIYVLQHVLLHHAGGFCQATANNVAHLYVMCGYMKTTHLVEVLDRG